MNPASFSGAYLGTGEMIGSARVVTDGVGAHTELLEQLGPHTTGVACIYIKDLAAVDLETLETIVSRSYTALTSDTYTQRAREGGHRRPQSPA